MTPEPAHARARRDLVRRERNRRLLGIVVPPPPGELPGENFLALLAALNPRPA
jgi:hypothetical protein